MGSFPVHLLTNTQIEGQLISLNNQRRQFKPCLNVTEVIPHLTEDARSVYSSKNTSPQPSFQREMGSFNIETTPGKPWGISSEDLLDVEVNMRWRLVQIYFACGNSQRDNLILENIDVMLSKEALTPMSFTRH